MGRRTGSASNTAPSPRIRKAISTAFPLRQNTDFREPVQSDLGCPDLAQKIFRFSPGANHLLIHSRLTPHEGRIAIVTDVGVGCGGRERRQACEGTPDEAPVADGKAVWS
jgi:hypothetical protein